jgi:predicted phage gp36 major capsid-like protein
MGLEPIRSNQLMDLLLGMFLQDGSGTHGGIKEEEAVDQTTADQVAEVMEVQDAKQGEAGIAEEEEAD